MGSRFYSEYVRHCLRFYARYEKPLVFRTDVDRLNWEACEDALSLASPRVQKLAVAIYKQESMNIAEAVNKVSHDTNTDRVLLWSIVKRLEKNVAIARGLI